jgi:hypothetical protein
MATLKFDGFPGLSGSIWYTIVKQTSVLRLGQPRRGISEATRNGEERAEQAQIIWEG